MNNSMNQGDQSLHNDYSNQDNSQMGGKNTSSSNYESEQRNRLHSDRVEAGQHNPLEDETQYGKTRENETGFGKVERKAEELKDKANEGFDKAENKVNEWGDKAENKMHEWGNKAENKMDEWGNKAENRMNEWGDKGDSKVEDADRKMDKAEKKMDKAQDKFAKGYENDGERKMEKAEKKMDKAEDKLNDAHEDRTNRNYEGTTGTSEGYQSRGINPTGGEYGAKDNAEDYSTKR